MIVGRVFVLDVTGGVRAYGIPFGWGKAIFLPVSYRSETRHLLVVLLLGCYSRVVAGRCVGSSYIVGAFVQFPNSNRFIQNLRRDK